MLQLGSPGLCAPILEANWTVCSALVGSGRGTVSVQLPSPLRVQLMQAAPPKITRADDPAAAPPIQYETSSRLSVSLEFSDGQVGAARRYTPACPEIASRTLCSHTCA